MNILLDLMGSLQMVALAFVATSLVSGLVYGLARLSSPKVRWVKIGVSVIASFVLILSALWLFAVTLSSFLIFLVGLVGLSTLQAVIERAIAGDQSGLKHYLIRTLFSYICSIFVAGVLFAYVVSVMARTLPTTWHYELNWDATNDRFILWMWIRGLNLYASICGLWAGLVVAPLSISFFRWMFQTLALHPGLDRPLRENEIVT